MPPTWNPEYDPFHRQGTSTNVQGRSESPSPGASMPSSGTQSPDPNNSGATRRKRVDWVLPDETLPEEEETDEEPESSAQAGYRAELERQFSAQGGDELHDELQKAFGDQRQHSPQPKKHNRDGSLKSPRRGSSPRSGPARPKPVLRKGDVTPTESYGALPEELSRGIEEYEKKESSAVNAHQRAERFARSVDASPTRSEREDIQHTRSRGYYHEGDALESGQTTPDPRPGDEEDYVPRPGKYRLTGLSAALLMNKMRHSRHHRRHDEEAALSPASSRSSSPRGIRSAFRRNSAQASGGSPSDLLVQVSSVLGSTAFSDISRSSRAGRHDSDDSSQTVTPNSRPRLPISRSSSYTALDAFGRIGNAFRGSKSSDEIYIRKHVQETELRQRYLLKLCRALMRYGAPSHRLEEYVKMSARVLETEMQVLYIPGCMILSFDDAKSHTAEVKLVRQDQGVELGRLRDTHDVYKDVVHDVIGVEEATQRLEEILDRMPKFKVWFRVLAYGVGSIAVGPYAFSGQGVDVPVAFLLGCILGLLQLVVSQQASLYSNVFEIVGVGLTSFLARAFGSIKDSQGEYIFCFSNLSLSAIALILPGYLFLCGALELQARAFVSGSVRLVYAIIYTLFLGFSVTLGTAIWGAMDSNAVSTTRCNNPIPGHYPFFFVPLFAICLSIANQAKWKDMPFMALVAFVGFVVSFYSADRFSGNTQISSGLGALAVSFLANIRSRLDFYITWAFNWCRNRIKGYFPRWQSQATEKDSETETNPKSLTPSTLEKQVPSRSRWRWYFLRLRKAVSEAVHYNNEKNKRDELSGEDDLAPETNGRKKQSHTSHAIAAASMLPAIFVLVPSGVAGGGSLKEGLLSAEQIVHHRAGSIISSPTDLAGGNSISFAVAYSVVQVVIGITVGLFLGSLFAYPLGKGGRGSYKMRSGLFSF